MAAGDLSLYVQNAAPRLVSITPSGTLGSLPAADYSLLVAAIYGDGDESNILNWGGYESRGPGAPMQTATAEVTTTGATSQIVVVWTPPERDGKTVGDVHHYVLLMQIDNASGHYDVDKPGIRCRCVDAATATAYNDGIIPWYCNSVILRLTTSTTGYASNAHNLIYVDYHTATFWIDGDYRAFLGPGVTVTVAGTTYSNGNYTVVTSHLMFTNRGPMTVIQYAEGPLSHVEVSTGTLTFYDTYGKVTLACSTYSYYAGWGVDSLLPLRYVTYTGVPAGDTYRTYNDMLSAPDREEERINDALDIRVNPTLYSCNEYTWAYLCWLKKNKAQLYLTASEDQEGGNASGAPTGSGYGPVVAWMGRISSISGHPGMRSQGFDNRSLRFEIEAEV